LGSAGFRLSVLGANAAFERLPPTERLRLLFSGMRRLLKEWHHAAARFDAKYIWEILAAMRALVGVARIGHDKDTKTSALAALSAGLLLLTGLADQESAAAAAEGRGRLPHRGDAGGWEKGTGGAD
ncbi:unnamed protein product, partial [Discosporangium mesarthrocarpum]